MPGGRDRSNGSARSAAATVSTSSVTTIRQGSTGRAPSTATISPSPTGRNAAARFG
jgi:hypothetical protein